jgi:23S rRNA (guanine2445-N2)-methyltransferase / 23S rRNA (guanine2069-N7)-methyltransferase
MTVHRYLATCPAGVGPLLVLELSELGAAELVERPVGVAFCGDLALAYRVCLWSRLANRVLLQLRADEVGSAEALYELVATINWRTHLSEKSSLMVDFSGSASWMRNAQFGAQKVKDAIVDQFRAAGLGRPSVDLKQPDVRVAARLAKGQVTIAIDLSGESLHRRGYRLEGGLAPLKENIAAAALWGAQWPSRSRAGEVLIDPMCGSGTLLLEAALMALDRAPGLTRSKFGFSGWLGHDPAQWVAIKSEAEARACAPNNEIEIRGYDGDIRAVRRTQENIARLGLEDVVRVRCKSLAEVKRPTHRAMPSGLLVMNPPWGERMGGSDALPHLYNAIGELMSREFVGWEGLVLTSDLALGKAIGLRAHKRRRLHNGRLELHCLQFQLDADNHFRLPGNGALTPPPESSEAGQSVRGIVLSSGALALANRLEKNVRKLKPWVKREGITCYRVYDRDIPEYAVTIDWYDGNLHVAEYQAPKTVAEDKAAQHLGEALDAIQRVFNIPDRASIALKTRSRQRGRDQYRRLGADNNRIKVREGAAKLLVNLHDYLDTGLFLDHRPLRQWLGQQSKGKHFLNLFSYTGAATVQAALGGAVTSTSVDASGTYLEWFRANLALNGLSERQHRSVRADVRQWLEEDRRFYDLIMLDPPSFSNSKGGADFDIQADHEALIELAMARLSPDGVLYFSTNRRKFTLEPRVLSVWGVQDVTAASIPPDYARSKQIHRCWRLTHRPT